MKNKVRTIEVQIVMLLVSLLFFSIDVNAQRTYVVAVGLGDYLHPEICPSLPCSTGDAKSMASFFYKYNDSNVFMLLNQNATKNHILKVLKSQFSKATENDEIIFAFSGHGFEGGLTTYDFQSENEAIFYTDVQNIMKMSRAKRKIIFAMACFSGGLTKKNNNMQQRNYHNNRQKSDVMLYVSSRSNEVSWESSGMTNSFFFYYILEGFKGYADTNQNGIVTARELFEYVNRQVLSATDNKQHPQMWGRFDNNMEVVRLK